jgi:hypothetical protein
LKNSGTTGKSSKITCNISEELGELLGDCDFVAMGRLFFCGTQPVTSKIAIGNPFLFGGFLLFQTGKSSVIDVRFSIAVFAGGYADGPGPRSSRCQAPLLWAREL